MCGFVEKLLGGILGGNDAPVVIRESPVADANKADAAASSAGVQNRNRRRRAAISLLATGGSGDTSSPVTGMAQAAPGKATLGA